MFTIIKKNDSDNYILQNNKKTDFLFINLPLVIKNDLLLFKWWFQIAKFTA